MRYVPVGFIGKKGHGKSEAGRALIPLGYSQAHPADPIREMLACLLRRWGYSPAEIDKYLIGEWKRKIIPQFGRTSTYMQQTLGTEWGRMLIKQTMWTELVLHQHGHKLFYNDSIRFVDEAMAIRRVGGALIKIINPRVPDDGDVHVSETELESIDPDWTIFNTGSIEDLKVAVQGAALRLSDRG